jgi:hypothetical protein
MSRISLIEQKLLTLNDAVFQELCDSFLLLRHQHYKAFIKSGMTSGKSKTAKGTPDTFILLPNDRYLFIEATTQQSRLLKKLKADLTKCLDESKTGIPVSKIQEIVLFFNSKLKPQEIEELNSLCKSAGVRQLNFYGLDRIAAEINLHHRNLAHEFLELSVDTGQIVSLEQFATSYDANAQRIATPLGNPFLFRENEQLTLVNSLRLNDLIIITGPAGVGKTKLAIEGIKRFQNEENDFDSYAIINKDADLLSDLSHYFTQSSKSILFIDDVNRFDRFSQVLGHCKHSSTNSLKIVLTVRDYALQQVTDILFDMKFSRIEIDSMTDEQIVDIVKGHPFNIKNSLYHREITRIAAGNPRLAIMAAQLAIKEQNVQALNEVSELFDHYFSSFIKDENAFKNSNVLKTLALVSFFHTLPYNDSNITGPLLSMFEIDRKDFIDSIETLGKLELVEIEFEHVKVGEQNLATYFFYKVFIRENILSFDNLLSAYFPSLEFRFRDTIVPAINTFGYANVEKITASLKQHHNRIKGKTEEELKLFEHFWFYLKDDIFDFILEKINSMPVVSVTRYTLTESENGKTSKDEYLDLLDNFFGHIDWIKDSLWLCFEFVKRKPESYSTLITKIRDRLSFDFDDEAYRFKRQRVLFDFLSANKLHEDLLLNQAFLQISPPFLKFEFQQFKGLGGGRMSIYRYPLRLTKESKGIREQIWSGIDLRFENFAEDCFQVLLKHTATTPDFNREIFIWDLSYVLPIINSHLNEKEFRHCYYVQELARWSKRHKIENAELQSLKARFLNDTYKVYAKLDWNILRAREEHEFTDFNKFRDIKEKEIRNFFRFEKLEQFNEFKSTFAEIFSWSEIQRPEIDKSVDIILEENIRANPTLGYEYFIQFLKEKATMRFRFFLTLNTIAKDATLRDRLWIFIEENKYSSFWSLEILYYLPETDVSTVYIERLFSIFTSLNESLYIWMNYLKKYQTFDNKVFDRVLSTIVQKNEDQNLKITFDDDFFEQNSEFVKDLTVLKKAYLQQGNIQSHFDYSGKALLSILRLDETFINDYLIDVYKDGLGAGRTHDHRSMSVIWQLNNSDTIMDSSLDYIVKSDSYLGIGEHFANAFFQQLSDENIAAKADEYLLEASSRFTHNHELMNIIFDVIYHSRRHLFDRAFDAFIAKEPSLDVFSEMKWVGRQSVYRGDVIIGDIKAAEWSAILSRIEALDNNQANFAIKQYIHDQVALEQSWANSERKRKFTNSYR